MLKLADKYPNTVYLLVRVTAAYCGCFILYFMMTPGGAGLMALYFFLTVGFVVPIALCVADVALGLTVRVIAVRFAVALGSGIVYGFLVVSMAEQILQSALYAGPLVAAATSNCIFGDRRK